MRIVIAGGTGFIGQSLGRHFLAQDQQLVIIGRDKNKIQRIYGNRSRQITALTWDEFSEQQKDTVLTSDLIINLAGANIADNRWSPKRKQEMIDSRVHTTKTLAESCALFGSDSPPLFNASAVGIYGLQKPVTPTLPTPFTEKDLLKTNVASDFVSKIVAEWEKATNIARDHDVRVIMMRFAPVLAKEGLLSKLYYPFKLGLGGPIGSGNQPFPFIALTDLIAAIEYLIANPNIRGPVNFSAPQCISQQQFAAAFANVLHRPCRLKTPAFLVKWIFGEMGEELLLNGQCVYPEVLLSHGFNFQYPDINSTLQHILSK